MHREHSQLVVITRVSSSLQSCLVCAGATLGKFLRNCVKSTQLTLSWKTSWELNSFNKVKQWTSCALSTRELFKNSNSNWLRRPRLRRQIWNWKIGKSWPSCVKKSSPRRRRSNISRSRRSCVRSINHRPRNKLIKSTCSKKGSLRCKLIGILSLPRNRCSLNQSRPRSRSSRTWGIRSRTLKSSDPPCDPMKKHWLKPSASFLSHWFRFDRKKKAC